MTDKKLKKEFERKFVKPFQKNKDFNELQLGTLEIRDYLMFEWFEKALQEREKEIAKQLDMTIFSNERAILEGYVIDWGDSLRKFIKYNLLPQITERNK